ncbi:hypothetical protein [Sphingobacterium chuzhouense]|uniref:Uncharacterized protein n=1 Tax=Sphingobacterium chuzhouense TaxID=1742264 RepID=A0ABR7XS64_9SPHI|nr:hypothetical protein [Sphingobacterium chuzhouense]MBD1422010.1 hypothetical protein [Sphingobacterium chuzhouense]
MEKRFYGGDANGFSSFYSDQNFSNNAVHLTIIQPKIFTYTRDRDQ